MSTILSVWHKINVSLLIVAQAAESYQVDPQSSIS